MKILHHATRGSSARGGRQAISEQIRVGMVRVDAKAYWFAPVMDACAALKLRAASNANYFLHYGADPNHMASMAVPGFSIDRIWDPDRSRAETFAKVMKGKPKVCRQVEDVGEDVDLIFINAAGSDGSQHLTLASSFLKAGLAVYVDSLLAGTLADAQAMVNLAKTHRAPLMSSSLLNFVPEVPALRAQIEGLGGARAGYVRGKLGQSKEGVDGLIHSLTLAQAVFGMGVEWVRSVGARPFEYLVLHYPNGLELIISNHIFSGPGPGGSYGLYCDAYTCSCFPRQGDVRSARIDAASNLRANVPLLEAVRDLVIKRKPRITLESTLELIQTIEAARHSHVENRAAGLAEVAIL